MNTEEGGTETGKEELDSELDDIYGELDDILNSISDDNPTPSCSYTEPTSAGDNKSVDANEISKFAYDDDVGLDSNFDEDLLNLVESIEKADAAKILAKTMCGKDNTNIKAVEEVNLKDNLLKTFEKSEDEKNENKSSSNSGEIAEKSCETTEISNDESSRTDDITLEPTERVEKNCETTATVSLTLTDDSLEPALPSVMSEPVSEKDTETPETEKKKVVEEPDSDSTEKAALENEVATIILPTSTDVFLGGEDDEAMDVDLAENEPCVVEVNEKTPLKRSEDEDSTTKAATAKLSETPEDLINILKMLSPEKLEVIKSQLFNSSQEEPRNIEKLTSSDKSDSKCDNEETAEEPADMIETIDEQTDVKPNSGAEQDDEKMEVDDNQLVKTGEKDKITTEEAEDDDVVEVMSSNNDVLDCVILLDSDEEAEAAATNNKPTETQPSILEKISMDWETPPQTPLLKQTSDENTVQPKKVAAMKLLECVNSDCPRDSNDFMESPKFILNFFAAAKKPGKVQYVCSSCNDKAAIKFEEMGEALLNNRPIFSVEVPKKNEMVEVIDSDDEEVPEEAQIIPESEKIVWNRDVELEVEEILQSFCGRIDFKKQLQFGRDDIQKRSELLDAGRTEFEKSLKRLEDMSNKMYNALYSINKPKIECRPALDIVHEFDTPKPSPVLGSIELRNRLTSKSQPLQAKKGIAHPAPEQRSVLKRNYVPIRPAPEPAPAPSPAPKMITIGPQPLKKVIMMPQQKVIMMPQQKVIMMPQHTAPKRDVPLDKVHFAVRVNLGVNVKMQNWAPCKLLETMHQRDNTKLYRVQFYDNLSNTFAIVKGKDISVNHVNPKLKIGARVIAESSKGHLKNKDAPKKFIPGVIGEKLSKHNNQRYLVFGDYGQVLYAAPAAVREIMECSTNVWEDVHENLRQFIFDYLQSQTIRQRALLNVRNGQKVKTEKNGEWKEATVAQIDCSIVKMHFGSDNSFEWLYRGSKRLGPIFQQGNRSHNTNARRNDPNITYITIDDDYEQPTTEEVVAAAAAVIERQKNTARKSTAPAPPQMRILQQTQAQFQTQQLQAPIILNDDKNYLYDPIKITKHRHFTPRAGISAKRYVAHTCSPSCLVNQAGTLSQYSPLSKPLLTCWERQIVRQKHNRWVQYKAPCGRRLRDMYEIHKYLKMTGCFLNVENFNFDVAIQVLAAYDVIDKDKCPLYLPDMSNGKEGMKIPIINAFDDRGPPELLYSAVRIPMKGVNINTDPAFRACCDCTDDCADKSKCACFQLTIQGMKFAFQNEDLLDDDVSYVWKRLLHPVQTGIYECGSHCKCTSRCLNKVVQQPIQVKMQLYRTQNRGWGLECCHDIPKGTFLCIYAGKLYREEDANALCLGLNHGDEYFAELDLIETATPLKNGYETGVVYEDSDTEEEEEKASDSDSDYDEKKANEEDKDFVGRPKMFDGREIVTRSTRGENKKKKGPIEVQRKPSNDTDSDGEMVNMMPKAGNNDESEPKVHRNLRKFFGKNERVYIMDAKECGNVGRYFNHCCDPNLTVQSVFVDTHDLRFPWIAFFASRNIKAGEELTWNYNYEVGSVPSKVLYCKCLAKNCRGRIL